MIHLVRWVAVAALFAAAPAMAQQGHEVTRLGELARGGDATAMVELGQAYAKGTGAPQNYADAVRWYREAADKGNAEGMRLLGELYRDGLGVSKDEAEALRWARMAAAKGNARAIWNVGMAYVSGKGVEKDYAEAVKWYRQAAAKDEPEGLNSLGVMYSLGYGVEKNKAEALRYFEKAADRGSSSALFNMSSLYEAGEGIPTNLTAADSLKAAWKRNDDPRNWRTYMTQVQPLAPATMVAPRAAEAPPSRNVDAPFVEDYRRDALAGSTGAMWALATHHEVGMGGFRKDINEAAKWYRMLSDRGDSEAREWLIRNGYPY